MRAKQFIFLLAVALLASSPDRASAEARHFQTSQLHFEDLANKAAVLSQSVEGLAERNTLNFYVALSVLYATRAHVLAQMNDILEALPSEREKAMVRQKLLQTRQYVSMNLASDIHELDGLATLAASPQVKKLGMRLINDLRVFQRNTETIH